MTAPTVSSSAQKGGAAGLAGALSVIVAWALKDFAGLDLPTDVAAALTTLVTFFLLVVFHI